MSTEDVTAWFAAMDACGEGNFMTDGREQPDMPEQLIGLDYFDQISKARELSVGSSKMILSQASKSC